MNPPVLETPPPRTWREIPQPITPRAMSREGRRRRALAAARTAGVALVALALGWGGVEAVAIWRKNPGALVAPTGGTALGLVTVRSDGVLGEEWTRAALALSPQARLMALDLAALRARLLVGGQVRDAELTRRLPDKLLVTLYERTPVARVLARAAGDDTPRTLLVAGDGTVFAGAGHAPEAVARLPFLGGVRLVREGEGFAPVAGMAAVADLLAAARAVAPRLARGFQVVSLARLAADGALVVSSDEVGEIVFAAREPFARQLARLELAFASARRQLAAGPLRVDLSLGGGQVLVARQTVAAAAAAGDGGLALPSLSSSPAKRPSSARSLPPPPAFSSSHAL